MATPTPGSRRAMVLAPVGDPLELRSLANRALADLRAGRLPRAAVLVP